MSTNEKQLKKMIEDVLWMARRYAHNRSTYAPSMVREVFERMRRLYPDWTYKADDTLEENNNRIMPCEGDDLRDTNKYSEL